MHLVFGVCKKKHESIMYGKVLSSNGALISLLAIYYGDNPDHHNSHIELYFRAYSILLAYEAKQSYQSHYRACISCVTLANKTEKTSACQSKCNASTTIGSHVQEDIITWLAFMSKYIVLCDNMLYIVVLSQIVLIYLTEIRTKLSSFFELFT